MSMTDEFTEIERLFEQGTQHPWQADGQYVFVLVNGARYNIAQFSSAADAAYSARLRNVIAGAVAELRVARSSQMATKPSGTF
jgi:hypothetical protein